MLSPNCTKIESEPQLDAILQPEPRLHAVSHADGGDPELTLGAGLFRPGHRSFSASC